jgi:hypothetical protein
VSVTYTCEHPGCDKRGHGRGLCSMHYYRLRTFGDPAIERTKGVTPRPAVDRLSEKLVEDDGCWLYTGHLDRRGYARVDGGLGHRFTYEFYIGDVPLGLELDHLCRRPSCVNPWHLEPVTHAENVRRGRAGWSLDGRCKNGHDLTDPDNVYAHHDGVGRKCKTCTKARAQARYYASKENAA